MTEGTKEAWRAYAVGPMGVRIVRESAYPHPYTIGSKHVVYAADHHGGMLGREAIVAGEERGIGCAHPRCDLAFDEHERALVVGVPGLKQQELNARLEGGLDAVRPGLSEYLKSLASQMGKDGYKGVGLMALPEEGVS